MRDALLRIREYTEGLDLERFCADRRTIDAVQRNLEVLCEAAKHLPEWLTAKYANIPWKRIIGMRDILAHDYDRVSPEIVWNTVQKYLPELEAAVDAALNEPWDSHDNPA